MEWYYISTNVQMFCVRERSSWSWGHQWGLHIHCKAPIRCMLRRVKKSDRFLTSKTQLRLDEVNSNVLSISVLLAASAILYNVGCRNFKLPPFPSSYFSVQISPQKSPKYVSLEYWVNLAVSQLSELDMTTVYQVADELLIMVLDTRNTGSWLAFNEANLYSLAQQVERVCLNFSCHSFLPTRITKAAKRRKMRPTMPNQEGRKPLFAHTISNHVFLDNVFMKALLLSCYGEYSCSFVKLNSTSSLQH